MKTVMVSLRQMHYLLYFDMLDNSAAEIALPVDWFKNSEQRIPCDAGCARAFGFEVEDTDKTNNAVELSTPTIDPAELPIDEIPLSWTEEHESFPAYVREITANSEEELEQSDLWNDPYPFKGPIFERDGKFVFRVERITDDTYGP